MNKDTAHLYLPLVQALADGKTIQTTNSDGEWMNTDEPGFMLDIKHYRIKPEPREWTVRRNTCTGLIAGTSGPQIEPSETIRVREILD